MEEIYTFLKECGTYYLATVEDDQPRVRPFGTIDQFDGRLAGVSQFLRKCTKIPRLKFVHLTGRSGCVFVHV